ncbi:hypothetical protein DPMN_108959 [Dreissena polymorpha]|uniref:Uncharacterized protein n=1 Tax=Dreissena polymorpha TaxID=45954 RepID=A0A9D4QLP8_DREPO|nr:hypothetical protein DPMN_108959 [Dreissena polymorpha]
MVLSSLKFIVLTIACLYTCDCISIPTSPLTSLATSSTPAASQPPTGPLSDPPNIFESAVFLCGDRVFNDALAMLFPPSDLSAPNIINATLAAEVQRQSLDLFCGRVSEYSSCVASVLKYSKRQVDIFVKQYINVDMFTSALGLYCANKDLIASQFHCTLARFRDAKNSCPLGGIYGIMQSVAMAAGITKAEYCSAVDKAKYCRVNTQLRPCNGTYADVMDRLYDDLTQGYCAQ